MNKLKKTIIVTGGTKGIGLALVQKFYAEGYDIITCSRNFDDLQQLTKELVAINKDNTIQTFVADLSKIDDCKKFVDFVLTHTTSIDALINNTGYFLPGQIHTEDDRTLTTMIETNLYSAYYVTKGLVSNMIENKSGHIFNICSTASIMAYSNGGSYCISKFALLGMSKVLREELKFTGVKVTAILPGATRTASWAGLIDELPEDRLMDPSDVAMAIYTCFILAPNATVEELLIRPQLGDL